MPSVAVCLPTYEPNPHLLRQTIESVLRQTHVDWTLLIHDDASEEDVKAIIEPFLKDPRIRFLRSEKRLGIGGNWNATFEAIDHQPEFVGYIFQDDLWEPQYLQYALAAFDKNRSAGMVAVMHHYQLEHLHPRATLYHSIESERRHVFQKGFSSGHDFLLSWIRRGLHPNIVGEPSFVVLKRDILAKIPWDERMVQCLDSDGWVRALQLTDIAFVPEDLGTFVVHGEGASERNQQSGSGLLDRLKLLLRLCINSDRAIRSAAMKSVLREIPKMALKFFRRLFT